MADASVAAAERSRAQAQTTLLYGGDYAPLAEEALRLASMALDPPVAGRNLFVFDARADGLGKQTLAELLHVLSVRSAVGNGARAAVIHGADLLLRPAANTLLKFLEEPPEGLSVVLTAHERGRVLPTVLSRTSQRSVKPDPAAYFAWARSPERGDRAQREALAYAFTDKGQALAVMASERFGEVVRGCKAVDDRVAGAIGRMPFIDVLRALDYRSLADVGAFALRKHGASSLYDALLADAALSPLRAALADRLADELER